MARERSRFGRNAFHQISVRYDAVRVVIDNRVVRPVVAGRQPSFRNRHSDSIAEPLSQRTRRDFDPRRMISALRMAGSLAAQLAEAFEFVERQIVAGKMQQAVEQHGTVPRRKNEPIAIGPKRIVRIEAEEAGPQCIRHGGRAHRHSGMPGVGVLHGVYRKHAEGIDAQIVDIGHEFLWYRVTWRRHCRPRHTHVDTFLSKHQYSHLAVGFQIIPCRVLRVPGDALAVNHGKRFHLMGEE